MRFEEHKVFGGIIRRAGALRLSLWFWGGLALLGGGIFLAINFRPSGNLVPTENSNSPSEVADSSDAQRLSPAPLEAVHSARRKDAAAMVVSPPSQLAQADAVQRQPTPETRLLVESLVKLQPENGLLTEELATSWKQNLQRLVQQGPAAIPAIQEFLAKNLDTVFGEGGRQMLGYSSARAAMLEALTQIGTAEGVAALSGVLQTTADPMEIALLAQDLEKLEPQQHQAEVLSATRQALDIAAGRKLESTDVAPLFEVLG